MKITRSMLAMLERLYDHGEPYHECIGVDRNGRTSSLRALEKRGLISRGKWNRWHVTERGRRMMARRVRL